MSLAEYWELAKKLEPELEKIEAEVRALPPCTCHDVPFDFGRCGEKRYCANMIYARMLKPRIVDFVGSDRRLDRLSPQHEQFLHSSQAYEAAIDALHKLLPPCCVGCGCLT